jgi:hypothetical protein
MFKSTYVAEQEFSWLSFMAAVASVSMNTPLDSGRWLNDEPDPRDLMRPMRMRPALHLPADHYVTRQAFRSPVLTSAIVPLYPRYVPFWRWKKAPPGERLRDATCDENS